MEVNLPQASCPRGIAGSEAGTPALAAMRGRPRPAPGRIGKILAPLALWLATAALEATHPVQCPLLQPARTRPYRGRTT